MAIAFVQALLTGNSKTASASLAITGSKTISVGNTVFLGFSADDVGSGFAVIDNLGNTYTQDKEQINTGQVKTQLWKATVTIGGTLTSQTISWTTNITAKAAVSGEFSGVGTRDLTDGFGASSSVPVAINGQAVQTGDLMIGAFGVEDNITVTVSGTNPVGDQISIGTSGTDAGGSATNIFTTLAYTIATDSSGSVSLSGSCDGTQDHASAGAVYSPAIFVPLRKPLILQQAVNRASTY